MVAIQYEKTQRRDVCVCVYVGYPFYIGMCCPPHLVRKGGCIKLIATFTLPLCHCHPHVRY